MMILIGGPRCPCAGLGVVFGLRGSERAACRFIPSPSAHLPGSGASATGHGGAPHWTNDLDR
jgi:hypothetical protein